MENIRDEIKKVVKKLLGVEVEPILMVPPAETGADYASNVALMLAKKVGREPREVAEMMAEELRAGELGLEMSVEVAGPGFLNFISRDEYLIEKLFKMRVIGVKNGRDDGVFGGNIARDGYGSDGDISRGAYYLEREDKLKKENISQGAYDGKTVVCEFSDPNPFKVLHVGHLYTSIVGEAISKLFEYAGAKVVRTNFGGDVGMHVAKAMWGILQKKEEFLALAEEAEGLLGKRAELMAKCYVLGTEAFESSEEKKAEIVALNKAIYRINESGLEAGGIVGKNKGATWNLKVKLEGEGKIESKKSVEGEIAKGVGDAKVKAEKIIRGEGMSKTVEEKMGKTVEDKMEEKTEEIAGVKIGEIAKLYWLGREWSYAYFEDFYKQVGARFDKYYPESSVVGKGLEKVKKGLAKGVYEESEGAVVYRGEKHGLHTRVFINNEGLPTYEAKDTGLIFRKWEDYQFDLSVVITGNDIVDYMKVVLSAISEYEAELPKRTRHLTHGNVRLPGNEKMSSRKGNFLKALDVLDLVKASLKEKYGTVDERVALSAVKYAFLKYKIGGNIIFNVEDSVSMTGNSGPYLQYAVVRAKKILAGVGGGYEVESCGVGEGCEAGNCVVMNSLEVDDFSVGGEKVRDDVGGELLVGGAVERKSEWVLNEYERSLVKKILQYGEVMEVAVKEMAPHRLCEYLYNLAQEFSRFYEQVKVVGSEEESERARLVGQYLEVMKAGLAVLGIEVPEEM